MDLLSHFKIEYIPGSVRREQMDDDTYFSKEFADYVSNSKMGLLNPAQGGSPQKFLRGFVSSGSSAFSLGSAVHQLTLEKNDYVLSDTNRPGGKLGAAYDLFIKYRNDGKQLEESMILACKDTDYYSSSLASYKGDGVPGFIRTAILKCLPFHRVRKFTKTEDGKKIIYLPSDLHKKCCGCTTSLANNKAIQEQLNVSESYCEDVIFCDVKVSFPVDFSNPDGPRHETIVKLKMKADHWSIDRENKIFTLNDVKTTGKPVQYFMGYEVEEEVMFQMVKTFKPGSWQVFHYARQMGMYLWMLKKYIDEQYGEGFTPYSNMLVVETIGNFNANLFTVNNDMIQSGFREFVALLKRVAYHQIKGYENILEFENPDVL